MTLFSNENFLKVSNNPTKNLTTMNAIAVMAFVLLFLTSILAHATHATTQVVNIELQDCHLCNQGIDNPPESLKAPVITVTSFSLFFHKITTAEFKLNHFVLPPLRAPPVFL